MTRSTMAAIFALSISSCVVAQPEASNLDEGFDLEQIDLVDLSLNPRQLCVRGRFVVDRENAILVPATRYEQGDFFHTAVFFLGADKTVISGNVLDGAHGLACGLASINDRCLSDERSSDKRTICTPIQQKIEMKNVTKIVVISTE